MQASTILHELFSSSIHATRLKGLKSVISAVIKSKKLQLSKLGRRLGGKGKERSGIRLIDNLLSNLYYQKKGIIFYKGLAARLLKDLNKPDIAVDWSSVPNSQHHCDEGEQCILRATLAITGRGITLYEEVHSKSKENNPKVHRRFLDNLKSVLPPDCTPCIITDAGFKNPWLQAVSALGWNYVGRVRGLTHYDGGNGFVPIKTLFEQAKNKACYLGFWIIAKTNPLAHHLVLYKGVSKGRHKTTKTKKPDQGKDSKKHSSAWKEPWILVTSLEEAISNPDLVRIKYKRRMTIEENIRDTKSSNFGFSFDKNITKRPGRYTVWLILAALASFIAWITGASAEKAKLHYCFQANSYKHRRVLSFVYLGCQIIRKKIAVFIEWGLILEEYKKCSS